MEENYFIVKEKFDFDHRSFPKLKAIRASLDYQEANENNGIDSFFT